MNRVEWDRKCTLVVCSCDAYADCWYPFFVLLKKYWPTMSFPIVLNSEVETFQFEGYDIKTFCLYKPNKASWGRRLKETLKRIDTEYILLMMDDFFINSPVRDDEVYQCLEWMEKDNKITAFSFQWTSQNNKMPTKYPDFQLRKQFGHYRFNCQAAIWRRERLISALRNYEDPWEWEVLGNWRSYRLIGQEFYSLSRKAEPIINYTYHAPKQGEWDALIRGEWLLPYVEPLFRENGIEVDFTVRGILPENKYKKKLTKYNYAQRNRYLLFLEPLYTLAFKVLYVIVKIRHAF